MPGALAKKTKADFDPVAWHDSPDGGARGVIAKAVSQPHIIDVMPDGRFDIYFLDKRDKPRHVASGRGNNVTTAKARATEKALANIKELRDALQADIIDAKATPVQRQGQAAWVKTVKIYIGLALSVAALIIFGRWLFVYRPVLALRVFAWVFGCLFAAHKILVWLELLDKRRTRLSRQDAVQSLLGTKGSK